jgi:hypothetical protein
MFRVSAFSVVASAVRHIRSLDLLELIERRPDDLLCFLVRVQNFGEFTLFERVGSRVLFEFLFEGWYEMGLPKNLVDLTD